MLGLNGNKRFIEASVNATKDFSNFTETKKLLNEQSAQLAKEKDLEPYETLNDLYLCHITEYFPVNGIIYPRLTLHLPSIFSQTLHDLFASTVSVKRPTIHFTVNSVVETHNDYKASQVPKSPLIIIDSLLLAKEQIKGGYVEDLFCIGPYKLSNQASILIPESLKYNQKTLDNLQTLPPNVHVRYYTGHPKDAVKQFLESKNAHYLNTENIVYDADQPIFFGRLGKKLLSSEQLLSQMGAIFCSHDITILRMIERVWGQSYISKPPYISAFENHTAEEVVDYLNHLMDYIPECFKLSASERLNFSKYRQALEEVVKMFCNAKSGQELHYHWEVIKDKVLSYDRPTNFRRPVEIQSTARRLRDITGLPFEAYYRVNTFSIVDAVCIVPNSQDQSHILQRLLASSAGIKFDILRDQDGLSITLRGINLSEVAQQVFAKFNEGMQAQVVAR